jgi:hypothetical protein
MTLIYPDPESFSVVFLDLHRFWKETVGLGLARNPADGFRIPKWKEQVAGMIGEAFFQKRRKKDDFSLRNALNTSNRPFLSQPLIGNRTMNEPHQRPKLGSRGAACLWPNHGLTAVFGKRGLLW